MGEEYSNRTKGKRSRAAEERLERLLRRPSKDFEWYYKIGELVATIVPTGADSHYGQNKMEGLVRRFRNLRPGLQPLLHGTRHLVATYKRSDLRRLSQLPWSHVARLASISDPRTREMLESRCIREKWTFLQLLAHYREALGIRPGGGRTAKPIQDVGPILTLSETVRLTEEWLRSYERRLRPPKSRLWKASRKKGVLGLDQLVSEAIGLLEEMKRAARVSCKELRRLRAQMNKTPKGARRGRSSTRVAGRTRA
jgi:hypothetical protein